MLKSIFVKQGKDVKCSNKAPCHNSTRLGDHHVASYEKYGLRVRYIFKLYCEIQNDLFKLCLM